MWVRPTAHTVLIMRRGSLIATSCAAVLTFVLLSGPAGASAKAPEPISGKLTKRDYTVIALFDAGHGRGTIDRATNGAFKLRPQATEVTLHLRAPDGTYAGPIVLERKGNPVKQAKKSLRKAKLAVHKAKRRQGRTRAALKRARRRLKKARRALKQARRLARGRVAIVGVKAETGHGKVRLGKVRVHSAAGYATAKLTARQWRKWADQERVATARRGVPIGAGNVGRVAVSKLNGPHFDLDRDGVPNPLDVDDDGDLVLDNVDSANSGSASAVASLANEPIVVTGNSLLSLDLPHAVNANVGSTRAQIDETLRSRGGLFIRHAGLVEEDSLPNLPGALPELDCDADPQAIPPRPALSYCSAGGTGRLEPTPFGGGAAPPDPGEPFPACCDPDGNGFGSLVREPIVNVFPVYARWLYPGATSAQIHTGDVLITRLRTRGGERQFAGVVNFVFATVPTLASFTDEAGNTVSISYPVPPGAPGTNTDHRFPVADGPDPDSDVGVTLNFWRPQRLAAPGEPGELTDVGNLIYIASAKAFGAGGEPCPPSAYTAISPDLVPVPKVDVRPGAGLLDAIGDRAPAPGNLFSFTLNLTECTNVNGGGFDKPGDGTAVSLMGATAGGGDRAAADAVWFTRK